MGGATHKSQPSLKQLKPVQCVAMTEFPLICSKHLKTALTGGYTLAVCACFSNALPLMVQGLLATAVLSHYRRALSCCRPMWRTLRYSTALGWEVADSGDFSAVQILPTTVMTTFALFLHVEIRGNHTHIKPTGLFDRIIPPNRHTLLLLPDSLLGQGAYRRLVVKLKTTYKIKSKSSNLLVKST